MKIFDPLRPRNLANLQMLTYQREPVCIIPSCIVQCNNGQWAIAINPLVNPTTSRTYYKPIELHLIGEFFFRWNEDPEGELLALGWEYQAVARQIPKARASSLPSISNEDLLASMGLL